MSRLKQSLVFLSCLLLLSGCSMLKYGNEPNYTLCKTIENKIDFKDNSTIFSTNPTSTYEQTASGNDDQEEKERLEETYERLNCSRYESLKF